MSVSPKRSLIENILAASMTFLLLALIVVSPANADAPRCENNFPDLVSDINWKTVFPFRLGGHVIMNYGDMKDNNVTENPDDFNPSSIICFCEDTALGYDRLGSYISFWEPARVIEVVRQPNCFPFLFGMDFGDALNMFGAFGTPGQGNSPNTVEKAFYNVHYYTFPVMAVMDLIVGAEWCTDWYQDIDLMYFSEVDPTWNNDELSIFTTPEAIAFGNPSAQSLCSVDCLTATAGFPLNALFWCAGCWGSMYPFTGNTGTVGSPVRTTSLLMARLLSRLARLPIPPAVEYDTSSSTAKCGGHVRPILKKSQYKFQTLFPIPQTEWSHSLGSSTFAWGEHRNIPATGEHQIYMMWRKRNCCLKLL